MGLPLGPTFADIFIFMKKCGSSGVLMNLNWFVIEDMRSQDHFTKFQDYLNKCHPRMEVSFEQERKGN